MTNEFQLDWTLPKTEFIDLIMDMIDTCHNNNYAIPIPLKFTNQYEITAAMAMVFSKLNCANCDARCCKTGTGNFVVIEPIDFLRLVKLGKDYSSSVITELQSGKIFQKLSLPCKFLNNSDHAETCGIYTSRPNICRFYPMQKPSNGLVSIAHDCKQAPAIAVDIYLLMYEAVQILLESNK